MAAGRVVDATKREHYYDTLASADKQERPGAFADFVQSEHPFHITPDHRFQYISISGAVAALDRGGAQCPEPDQRQRGARRRSRGGDFRCGRFAPFSGCTVSTARTRCPACW